MSLLTEAARLEGNTAVFVIVTDDMVHGSLLLFSCLACIALQDWAKQHLAFQDLEVAFIGHSKVTAKDESNTMLTGADVGEDLALLAACNQVTAPQQTASNADVSSPDHSLVRHVRHVGRAAGRGEDRHLGHRRQHQGNAFEYW